MSDRSPARALRTRLATGKVLLLAGAGNATAARIAEDCGHEALYLGGGTISNGALGLPDIGFLTLNDVADTLARISYVTDLPIMVDADTGYGNAVNTYHTVRRLEQAGAAAIQIEDQRFPKRCGHFDGTAVIAKSEMVTKIKAAVDARRDPQTVIVARTDARASEGFEAAMERAASYVEAGADILFVEALASPEEIAAVPAAVEALHMISMVYGGKTPAYSRETLESMGYRLVLYANAALQAAMAGMQAIYKELAATGTLDGVSERLMAFSERQRLVDKDFYDSLEHRYGDGG